MVLGVPVFEHIVIRLYCAQILGHLKIINFTIRTNENFIIFGFPNTYAFMVSIELPYLSGYKTGFLSL